MGVKRRVFFGVAFAGSAGWLWDDRRMRLQRKEADARLPATVGIVEFSDSGRETGLVTVPVDAFLTIEQAAALAEWVAVSGKNLRFFADCAAKKWPLRAADVGS